MSELLEALPDDVEHTACKLLAATCERELLIATVESCTGGLLASLLTDVEGASHAFERGFVTYSDDAKRELVGVPAATLAQHGAVSRQTALAMARGGLQYSRADVVLAITGFAGSAGPGDEPGLVHIACATRSGQRTAREEHFGDIGRGPVRIEALRAALAMLSDAVEIYETRPPARSLGRLKRALSKQLEGQRAARLGCPDEPPDQPHSATSTRRRRLSGWWF